MINLLEQRVDVEVKSLCGKALAWATACATRRPAMVILSPATGAVDLLSSAQGEHLPQPWAPQDDWRDGGDLIHEYRMNFATIGTGPIGQNGKEPVVAMFGRFDLPVSGRAMKGETHLIAACRSIVATFSGDVVQVPAYLVQGDAQ